MSVIGGFSVRFWVLPFICIAIAVLAVGYAGAQQSGEAGEPVLDIRLGYLRAYEPQLALSVLDVAPRDEGVAGAQVAIGDNNTTGRFLRQTFSLDVREVKIDADITGLRDAGAARSYLYPG